MINKKIWILLSCVLIVCNLCSFCFKNSNNCLQKSDVELKNGTYRIDDEFTDIYNEFIGLLPENVPKNLDEISEKLSLTSVFEYAKEAAKDFISGKVLISLLGLALLFALFETLSSDLGELSLSVKCSFSVVLAIPVLKIMEKTLLEVAEGMSGGSELFSLVTPTVISIAAISNGSATASVAASSMSISLAFVSQILSNALMPASALIFSSSMISSFDTGGITNGISRGVRGWFNYLIGISSLIILSIFSCQTVISKAVDSTAQKGARYAIANMIPIVGGVVSGAFSTLISGAKMLSGVVGVISCIAIISVMGAPLVKLLFLRFCVGACILVVSFSSGGAGERFFASVRSALDTVIAIFVSSLLIYALEIFMVTRTLGG